MANLKCRLSTIDSNGRRELLLRFYASRACDLRAHTFIYVPADKWDDASQRLIIPRRNVTDETIELVELQTRIDELFAHIHKSFQLCGTDTPNKEWLEQTIARFHNPESEKEHILLSSVIDEYMDVKDLDDGTRRQYRVLRGMLERYADEERPLYVGEIDARDIESFVLFLRSEKRVQSGKQTRVINRCQNTINSKLRRMRAVCEWLKSTKRSTDNPFDNYKIPADVYGDPTYLTIEERDALYRFDFGNAAWNAQRDVFVFQCHVGCRVSDLQTFNASNITDNGEVLQYIQRKSRRKRPVTLRVPLSSIAREIIERYAGEFPNGRLLPVISQTKYNEAIKHLLRTAGITRVVLIQDKHTYENVPTPICDVAASHLARRTCAENIFERTLSDRIVSSITGHVEGSAALKRYTKVTDAMKRRVVDSINEQDATN